MKTPAEILAAKSPAWRALLTGQGSEGDKTHDWFVPSFIGYECCRICGIVRRADRQNKPCRGPVPVGPRDAR